MKSKTGRNNPCPCGSVNKYKKCCMAINNQKLPATWADKEGANVIARAEKPTPSEIEQMTKEYQNQLRNS
jgi:predicted HAD superfamily phosphohydrolase YqeG